MTLDQFKTWAESQGSVGNPGTGSYRGECVSLCQQYLDKVFGIPYQARGNAIDWPTNPNVLSYFDKLSSPQTGDIGVMGSNYGGGDGHIFIYLTPTTILEQNGRVPLKISTGAAYANPIAILRRKGTQGGDMPLTQDQIKYLYSSGLGREAMPSDIDANTGKDPGTLIDALRTSKERQDYINFETRGTYEGFLQREPEDSALANARNVARVEFVNDVKSSDEAKKVTAQWKAGAEASGKYSPVDETLYRKDQ